MDNENNVAGNAYYNLEEYASGLVFEANLPTHLVNPYIESAEKLLDNDNISDEVCAEKIGDLINNLEREVAEYRVEFAEFTAELNR